MARQNILRGLLHSEMFHRFAFSGADPSGLCAAQHAITDAAPPASPRSLLGVRQPGRDCFRELPLILPADRIAVTIMPFDEQDSDG